MPYGPTRLLDTRKGLGAPRAKVPTGSRIVLQVAGTGDIPSDATAVAVNLTATDTTANGYVTAGQSSTVSNLNYRAGQTIANSAIVPLDPGGTIEIANAGNKGGLADLIMDVTGYFTKADASQYGPAPLQRILDTRHGTGAKQAQVPGGAGVPVTIAGIDSIPADATAVAVHVTVTDTAGNGWIAAEPDGAGTPTTSILNYLRGQTVSNTVIVPVAADGKIELYNGGTRTPVDLIADVSGYFSTDAPDAYMPYTPTRVWDSRQFVGVGLWPNQAAQQYLAPDGTGLVFPPDATVITNITLTNTTANGYITAYPDGASRPAISNLNYLKGQTVAGLGILSSTGWGQSIDVYNTSTGTAALILDVFGYFSNY